MNRAGHPGRGAGPPREVRVIGGRWKRSRLPVPDSPGLRPTPDRVRETLFNWLGQDLAGWHCLDAFAGTGALGIEAASRGAVRVVLVERDARLASLLRGSIERLGAASASVVQADALAWMPRQPGGSFDLVLLDPPFDADLFAGAVAAAVPLLAPGGFLYLEADRAWSDADWRAAGLEPWRQLRAGTVHAHLVRTTRDRTPRQEGERSSDPGPGLHCTAASDATSPSRTGAETVAPPAADEPRRPT